MWRKSYFSNWQIIVLAISTLVMLVWPARLIKNNWMHARGYEQEWVADSILGGQGYSFDPYTAWLGPYGDRTAYTPTAWVEPLYILLIAISFDVFGEYGRLLLVLLNIVWLGAASIMIFHLLSEILDQKIGLGMGLLYFLVQIYRVDVVLYIGNAALAGFLYCVIIYLLMRCLKVASLANCVLLGFVIGLANLNHASSLLFGPLATLIVLLANGVRKVNVWKFSISIVITVLAVLSPWIWRNHVVFDSFVPVRSGFGYQLYIGNPGLARIFATDMNFDAENTDPPWKANSPLHALRLLRNLEYDSALAAYSIDFVGGSSSSDYQDFNEVERDRVFLGRGLAFIWAEPLLAARMLFWKAVVFFTFWEVKLGLISFAALLGGVLMIRDTRVFSIFILVLGYVFPYIISLPLYYRYRSSLEPMLFILAGCFLGICFQMLSPYWTFVRSRFSLLNK